MILKYCLEKGRGFELLVRSLQKWVTYLGLAFGGRGEGGGAYSTVQ